MTPPRTEPGPAVRPFPVFRVIVAADGASATFNGHPVPTIGYPDLLAAVQATAGAAATRLGGPVRMDLTTPTGQVRHLIAHPTATPDPDLDSVTELAAPEPVPVDSEAVDSTDPAAGPEPAPARVVEPTAASAGPDPVVLLPRGDAVTTPPTIPPAAPLNGHHQPRRLTPLDDPLPYQTDPQPAPFTGETGTPGVPASGPGPVSVPLGRARDLRRIRGPRPVPDQPTPAVPVAPPSTTPEATAPAAAPAAAVPPVLAPAGLLPRLRPTTARPTLGWQARVHTWTRGRWSPPPSAAETRHLELVAAVQAGFTGPRLVAVVNPKGGAGKTPAVLATAATWGAHRGSVMAWDDNETRGTLAMRALADPRNPTVAGLLADLHRFDTSSARVGDLAAYLRPQGGARFDVLASDDDPARMAQFGAGEFARVRDVLARFYAITVVDTGNNVRAGNWQAAVDAADQLLLVSTYQRDAAVTASWTLDHLHATGRGHLADTAVTVLSAATPSTDRRTRTELRDHFATRTRTVVEIPYDPLIADGEHLDLHALRPATREAWLAATAALTDGIAG